CVNGYEGNTCGTLNLCYQVNCGEHGTCNDGTCSCQDNYYGNNCENAPLNCQNGGSWNTTTHKCDCVNGYEGNTCGTLNLCYQVNCGEHGTCNNGTCSCRDNYYGNNCENAPLNCQNGGSWNTTTHKCDCVNGYEGNTCETQKSTTCTSNSQCPGNTFCMMDNATSGTCQSPGTYTSYLAGRTQYFVSDTPMNGYSLDNWCSHFYGYPVDIYGGCGFVDDSQNYLRELFGIRQAWARPSICDAGMVVLPKKEMWTRGPMSAEITSDNALPTGQSETTLLPLACYSYANSN
ncbi:MAG: hypothetical protein IJV07_04000, partial [Alphaproteobacteria bacterium]|nr:hypothetical protein [Alphaproteobacteria bacterium]